MSDPRLIGGAQKTIEDLLDVLEAKDRRIAELDRQVKHRLCENIAQAKEIERLRAVYEAAKYARSARVMTNTHLQKLDEALAAVEEEKQ